jgi:hypothetical protein
MTINPPKIEIGPARDRSEESVILPKFEAFPPMVSPFPLVFEVMASFTLTIKLFVFPTKVKLPELK